jgi:hypothetical protein
MKENRSIIILLLPLILFTICYAGQWEVIGDMPLPVSGGQALVLDSLIYILGGVSDSLSPVNWIQVYDPAANQWQMAGQMLWPRYGFVADRLNDSLVVLCGGIWQNTPNSLNIELWNYKFMTQDQNLNLTNDTNFNRIYFTGHVYGNSLFLFGGLMAPFQSDSSNLSFIVQYDIFSAMVSPLQEAVYSNVSLPYHHMSVRLGSVVYLIGGVHFNLSDKVMKYDLETNLLEAAGTIHGVRAGGQAVTDDSRIYIIGGYNERERALNRVEYYDPVNNVSTFGPPLNYPREESMAVVYNHNIYVFGGKGSTELNVRGIEKLDLLTDVKSTFESMDSKRHLRLYKNYPNPFNSTTVISFDLDQSSRVSLEIYSVNGQYIKTLVQNMLGAGSYKFYWDGLDQNQASVASGIYIYQIRTGDFSEARKMMLIR